MVALSPAFLTLAVFCTSALAAPWVSTHKQATHRIRSLPNGLKVKSYHPQSTYQTFPDGIDPPVSADGLASDFKASALSFLHSQLGEQQVQLRSSFKGDTAKHVYVNQHIGGIPVANAVAHSTLNNAGKVVAYSSSFVTAQDVPSSTPKISKEAAAGVVKSKLSATPSSREVGLEYFAKDDGTISLSHTVEATIDGSGHLVKAFIDAHDGSVVGLIDYTTQLTYLVNPITQQNPQDGFVAVVDPEDKASSPNGWTVVGGTDSKATTGNNAVAYKSSQSSTTKQSAAGEFKFPWAPTSQPTVAANIDAARVNAFYLVNSIHDIAYRYGFTEAAFNFQKENFNNGGKGNDLVTISIQDSAGTDNADFTTPADGSSGRMRMYLFDLTNPKRDGALENDIVVHEMTHGITNRMTGGGTGECLSTDEAGGMGEGWSDSMAFWTEQTSENIVDFTLGEFVTNDPAGIRSHPYSTSKTVNPYTYATLSSKNEVHDIGEVWANMLFNVYAALVAEHGFDKDAKTNPDSTAGNAIWLHLFIDALPLQPCNPTFVTARDAWIQADKNRYSGANSCTLWKAFASRGLGQGATSSRKDDSKVPAECSGGTTPTSTTKPVTTTTKPVTTTTKPVTTTKPGSTTKTTAKPTSTSTRHTTTTTEDPDCPWWWPFC